jgi:hypothetical protein
VKRVVILLLGLSVAMPAAAEPPLGSRLGDRMRPGRAEDAATAARRGHAFAACMSNKRPIHARRLLAQTDQKGYEKAYKSLVSGEIECFTTAFDDATHVTEGWKLTIPPAVLRGLIAEHLIKRDMASFAALPPLPRQMVYVRPWYAGTTRYDAVDEMATCASETAPAETMALLRTVAYSAAEQAAIGTLAPALGPCLRAGFQLDANRQALRAALAEALYQRAQSWPVAQPPLDGAAPGAAAPVVNASQPERG